LSPYSTTVITPTHGWLSLQLGKVWKYRELLYFLVWRDIKVRYKQTVLGVAWIVLQPVVSMIVFSLPVRESAQGLLGQRALSHIQLRRLYCPGTTSPSRSTGRPPAW
jgi:hypothetical protein